MAMDQAQSKTGELQAAETGGVMADQTKAAERVSGAKKVHGHGFKSKLKAFLRRAAYAALCGCVSTFCHEECAGELVNISCL